MDFEEGKERIANWKATLSPTQTKELNQLTDERIEAQRSVDDSIKNLERYIESKNSDLIEFGVDSLIEKGETLKYHIKKELKIYPKRLRETQSIITGVSEYEKAHDCAIAKGIKFFENKSEREEEVIQLSTTDDSESESESEFKSEEEEINDKPHSTPESLHTMDAITNCESKLPQAQKDLLDTKKLERRSIRIQVTKAVNKLKKDVDAGNKFTIMNSKVSLQKALEELDKKDNEVWQIYDDDAVAADMSQGEQWTENGSAAITKADEFLESVMPTVTPLSPSPAPTPSAAHHARLPKIDLPKFSGKSPSESQTWWNSFESLIDKRSDLAKVDKLIYLKNCCIDNTKKMAEGYSLTDDNYENFKVHLKEMFGKPRLVQQSHVQNILSLKPFEIDSINPFLTALETALRCLSEYKIDMENLAPMVVPHVENLMPKEIKRKWREEINDDDTFSTKKLLEFLHEKMQCYDAASEQKADAKHKSVQPKTTLMLTTASREVTCFCCDRDHRIFNCEKFKKLSPKERSDFIFKKKHCQKCLMPITKDHFPKTCKSPIKCRVCQKPHHTLLHWGKPPVNDDAKAASSTSTFNVSSTTFPKQTPKLVPESLPAKKTCSNALHHAPLKRQS